MARGISLTYGSKVRCKRKRRAIGGNKIYGKKIKKASKR